MVQGQLANGEMERVATDFVAALAKRGVVLDWSPGSLQAIDQLLAEYGHGEGNGQKNMDLVLGVAPYWGEVLRRHLGGDWYENVPPDGATGLLLDEPREFWVWCHAMIYKQLENGGKSFGDIYPDIAARLQNMQKGRFHKSRWWPWR
jgi:hypothetical protein